MAKPQSDLTISLYSIYGNAERSSNGTSILEVDIEWWAKEKSSCDLPNFKYNNLLGLKIPTM